MTARVGHLPTAPATSPQPRGPHRRRRPGTDGHDAQEGLAPPAPPAAARVLRAGQLLRPLPGESPLLPSPGGPSMHAYSPAPVSTDRLLMPDKALMSRTAERPTPPDPWGDGSTAAWAV